MAFALGLTWAFGSGALRTALTLGEWVCLNFGPALGDKDLGAGGALEGGGGGVGFREGTLDEAPEGPGLSTTRSEAVELACDSALGTNDATLFATLGGGGCTNSSELSSSCGSSIKSGELGGVPGGGTGGGSICFLFPV